MSFILEDGPQVDGLNLGVVVVDEKAQSVILVYTVCFHQYKCITSSVMMVESLDDGLSWSRPRNLSEQLGVKSFAPGPGLGIQVRNNSAQASCATGLRLLGIHGFMNL